MTNDEDRISDALYEEMDLWFGALVRAFCDESHPAEPGSDFSPAEAFFDLWKHDIKIGMGVSCIMPGCVYCLARQQAATA